MSSNESTTVRTRFAPSPTGTLHLGNVRTALFAWAYARKHNGKFILRIEDTDQARSSEQSAAGIIRDLKWLGLDYDEGPFFQMQRLERYQRVVRQMLDKGLAYRCYMSEAELDALRDSQKARGEKPRYDGRWRPERGLTPPHGVQPVIRFRNPDTGSVVWDDEVKGRIEIANSELDDLVIARPDGTPTYNFCVVVDDMDMAITHVVRGDGHVGNTPRQINIFQALGYPVPVFAHLPTVLGSDGEKLSKRHGATGLDEYAANGYLPSAVINGLARMGFAHGNDEVFTPEQLVQWFDLSAINPAPARFDQQKFEWIAGEHLKRVPTAQLARAVIPFLPVSAPDEGTLAAACDLYRDRVSTLKALAQSIGYFFTAPLVNTELLVQHLNETNRNAFTSVTQALGALPTWDKSQIGAAIKGVLTQYALKPPQLMMPIRVAVSGGTSTPSVDATLEVLGRTQTLERLRAVA
jgi:glutamyl-tRNA synthetase